MERYNESCFDWWVYVIAARVMITACVALFVMWSGMGNYILDHAITYLLILGEYAK